MTKLSKRTDERKDAVFYLYQYELTNTKSDNSYSEFSLYLIENVLNRQTEIDTIISSCLTNYSLNRLSYVDRAIIRVATLEMLENKEIHSIIINEAIEITKIYTNLDENKEKAFNNRLLDSISKFIRKE